MSSSRRLLIAISCGVVCAFACWLWLNFSRLGARDFTWPLQGARLLIAGKNPYTDPAFFSGLPFDHDAPLYYPLPAVLIAIPFAFLPDVFAAALFIGVSTAILVYVILAKYVWQLIVLASPCFLAAIVAVQWSPLVLAAAFSSALLPLVLVKPNLGIPIALYQLLTRSIRWYALALCGAIVIISLIVLPSWPFDLLTNLGYNRHSAPVTIVPLGPCLLIVLLAWRNPQAWFLIAMMLMPQRIALYDQLPLLLIARSAKEVRFLTAWQWIGLFAGILLQVFTPIAVGITWILTLTYLPAVLLVLWQTYGRKKLE